MYPSAQLSSSAGSKLRQRLLQRFDKIVFAPHDGLIHTEFFVKVINATSQNTLPLLVFLREMLLTKRSQDLDSDRPIVMTFDGIMQKAAQSQQSGGSDSSRGS